MLSETREKKGIRHKINKQNEIFVFLFLCVASVTVLTVNIENQRIMMEMTDRNVLGEDRSLKGNVLPCCLEVPPPSLVMMGSLPSSRNRLSSGLR